MMAERYEMIGLLVLVALALLPPGLTLLAFMDWLKSRLTGSRRRKWLPRVALAADVLLALCLVDGSFIEPHRLTVTRITDSSPKIARTTGDLTIVHISDIHFERDNSFARKVLATIAAEEPDLILLTGDIPQLGPFDKGQLSQWLGKLRQIAPVYAVPGYYEDDAVLAGSPINDGVLLASKFKETEVRGTKIVVQGFGPNSRISAADPPTTDDAFYIVLDHRPDSIPGAARLKPDWFFCGHTHGGQVRLPFWGAIVTASFTGKQYEYGRYRVGAMQAFVTRGIGLEPHPAPQVRFLCPPEIVVLTIGRSVNSER
jgi:hypothetical protein